MDIYFERRRKVILWSTVAVLVICGLLLAFSALGKGKLRLDVPANTQVYVNGHRVSGPSVSLRAGTYKIATTSADRFSSYETVSVKPFLTTTFDPVLIDRDPLSIVTSTIGASGLYGKASFDDVHWFDNRTWVVGVVGPGSASFIALHYTDSKWTVAYYDGDDSYSQDRSTLPADVAGEIATLKAQYADN